MPLYEYECSACHRRTEKIQKFSDPELTVCPHCAGALERTITAPSFQFSGGGWYKDLYSSAAKPGGEGASADKVESKPAGGATDPASSAPAAAQPAASTATPAGAAPAAPSSGAGASKP